MSQQEARIFGTDGIRGRAGEGWLSAESVSRVGRALGEVLGAAASPGAPRRALLGHDGRRSATELEAALGRGLAAEGFEVSTTGLVTTPGLAWLTRTGDFALGAMLSASHNPAEDNGIKVFNGEGSKLSDAAEEALEAALRRAEPCTEGPTPRHDADLERDYLMHLLGTAGKDLDLLGMHLVVDCANGGGSRLGSRVFGRLGAQVSCIADEPDGDNINRDCGSTHPQGLMDAVRKKGAHMGIALDGDGDRCILVDERGEIVHGDGILTVIARHSQRQGALDPPRIVATVMSNRGLHRALRDVGVGVHTVSVGDRHVVEGLRAEGLAIGGEQSGHIIFGADNHYIGDGLYTALRVLRVLKETGESLSSLAAPYQPFPQVLLNLPVHKKPALEEMPEVAAAVQRIEGELGEDGRVLLRYSGTEPLARVMVEGPDPEGIQAQAQSLVDLLRHEIGQE